MMPFARTLLLAVMTLAPLLDSAGQDRRGPFTHPKRSVRSREIDQLHVRLDLKFNWQRKQIQGTARLRLIPFKDIRQLKLDAAEMQIHRVALTSGGVDAKQTAPETLKHQTRKDQLLVDLGRVCPAGQTLELHIDYTVTQPVHGAHFVVPDPDEPDQPQMVWTQSEPEYARYWYPCIDSPSDRLTSEILATVPQHFFVLSNGVLRGKTDNDDGTRTWHWSQRKSHVPYLLSVVAGEFEAYEQIWDGIPIVSYVPKGRLADASRSFEKTRGMMQYFSRQIGYRYPWPKYAQICVDEYEWGGMEHTSATTLNLGTLHDRRAHLDVSSDNLVAHELVHQWFGDLLTCKDWAELWLNESFATYFATLWTEHDQGWEEATWARYREARSYMDEDRRYRRPIVSYRYNHPGAMFDRHSYPKGGRVLHMLRYELGDKLFWKAIRHYTQTNQLRTVETADLRRAIEDATGQGLNWFFDQWLYHGGHPEFEVSWSWDAEARLVRLTVKQTQKVDQLTPLFRSSVEVALATPDGVTSRRVTVSKAEETFHLPADQRPRRVSFDPDDWILKTLKFEKSKEELMDQLANDSHMMCRVRAAQQLADFPRHQDARQVLIAASRDDRFWAVRQEAAKALAKFKGDEVRGALVRAATDDSKSYVRRQAITSLAAFKHPETRTALRKIVADDQSYYAVAEALKSLVKVDRDQCADLLLDQLHVTSHRDVVLKAAADGLVQLKDSRLAAKLKQQLAMQPTPSTRMAMIAALARLKPDDQASFQLLKGQLENQRYGVRRAAVEALAELATTDALSALRERRGVESHFRLVEKIDLAIEKIESKQNETEKLRQQLEAVKKQNRSLENRIRKLEQ